ncbi:MAG: DUF805 domain-containing protein [Proteobacteria bacterium]|nr:DUF805 domain-containing protein [Candidatus Enterousia scatequi]
MPAKKKTIKKSVAKKAPVKKTVKTAAKKKVVAKKVARPIVVKAPEQPKQKVVSLWRAIANFFKGYFNFTGTATRSEYWWMFLMAFGPAVVLTIVTIIMFARIPMVESLPAEVVVAASPIALWWCWALYALWGLIIIIPMWALMARRLHDAGMTAHLLWINLAIMVAQAFLPLSILLSAISWFWSTVMLIFMLFPSKLRNNRYR